MLLKCRVINALDDQHRKVHKWEEHVLSHASAKFKLLRKKLAKSGISEPSYSWMGWGLVTFALASFLVYISLLLRLPIFSSKKLTSLTTEKKRDSGNYFHFPIPDPHGLHILPQAAEWPSLPPQQHLLTLGFRSKHIGKILESWSSRKLPIFSGTPTCLIAVRAQG